MQQSTQQHAHENVPKDFPSTPRLLASSRQRRIGPELDPTPPWPPDPGPNAQYATTSPTVDIPANRAVLLQDASRCSTDRANSPRTTTVSPAHRRMFPRRDSTDSTDSTRPPSDGPTSRPRTTSTFGPTY